VTNVLFLNGKSEPESEKKRFSAAKFLIKINLKKNEISQPGIKKPRQIGALYF